MSKRSIFHHRKIPIILCKNSEIPKRPEQIKALAHLNLGLVVSIFDDPLPKSFFPRNLNNKRGDGISNLHLLCANYKGAKLEALDSYVKKAEKCIFENRKGVVAHVAAPVAKAKGSIGYKGGDLGRNETY